MKALMHGAGLLVTLLLLAPPAQAHKLKVFATAEGSDIIGTTYFSGGDRAMEISGVVTGPDGSVAGKITTDRDGVFRFTATSRMDHTITMDAGDGHMASTVLPATELPPSLPVGQVGVAAAAPHVATVPANTEAEAVEAAVARQIRPLRQQLDAYEDKIRLHDILGGIGTIFGLFGIAAWISARRRPQ